MVKIYNRYNIENRFINIDEGSTYEFQTDAQYTSIHKVDDEIVAIDPEGGLPINMLSIGDKVPNIDGVVESIFINDNKLYIKFN